jgi:hypothetical protein
MLFLLKVQTYEATTWEARNSYSPASNPSATAMAQHYANKAEVLRHLWHPRGLEGSRMKALSSVLLALIFSTACIVQQELA